MSETSPPPIRGAWRDDLRARAAYAEGAGIFRIVPRAVCRPLDAADLSVLVRWAAERGVPLVPRGAGSAMSGSSVGPGVLVDCTGLAEGAVLEIDPATRRARTGAPVPLGVLNAAAARHGLRLPPDPSSARWATAGGVTGTNAAGARTVKYGSVRRWIDGVRLVTADGERQWLRRAGPGPARFEAEAAPAIHAAAALVLERWPRTRKNSAGYALDAYLASGDALDLVIGAEGTLGFVTEVEWRLDALPARTAALRVALESLGALSAVVGALAPFAPSAVELLDETFLRLVAPTLDGPLGALARSVGALVLVELEGDDPAALAASVAAAAEAVRPWAESVETAVEPGETERLWHVRHAASPILAGLPESRRSLQVIEDACVPVARISDYVRAVRREAAARGLDVVIFGHAGDGNVHVNLLPELARPDWERAVADLLEAVTAEVLRLGGTPSGEHGAGRLRAAFLERVYGPEIVDLFRRTKASFDPSGILNPGVILPGDSIPIQQLKTGAGAAALPADIAAALREIERTGGYATPRLELADRPPQPTGP